jgi:AraC-like DNA-binding protein
MKIHPGVALEEHSHSGVTELALLLRGRLVTRIGDCQLKAGPGQLLIYPADTVHQPRPVGTAAGEWISLWWHGGLELGRVRGPEVRSDLHGRIGGQLAWLVDLPGGDSESHRRMRDCLAYTIVYELGQLADASAGDLAGRVRRYLRENLSEPIRLEDLADRMGLSKYHFVRKFKQATGQTPMRMLNEMRVDSARTLLTQTDLSLDEIAAHVGLADASHLSHTFRRIADCTPGSLRIR